MFQSSTTSILPTVNPSVTQNSETSNHNWKTWAKAGLIFATTAGAFLTLRATGSFTLISSWFRNNSSVTDGLTEDRVAEVKDDVVVSDQIGMLEDGQHTQTMQHNVGLVTSAQKAQESFGLTDFKELPLHNFQKRQSPVFPAVIELSSLDGSNGFTLLSDYTHPRAVRSVGDVNGDGIEDFMLHRAGHLYVIFGHSGTWPASVELSSLNGTNGFSFTNVYVESFNFRGDFNNDGINDIIVGDWVSRFLPGETVGSYGHTYVIFGHIGNWTSTIDASTLDGTDGFRLDGTVQGEGAGQAVNSADVNDDGIDDIVIGAKGVLGVSNFGYVVFGHNGTWTSPISLATLDGINGFKLYDSSDTNQVRNLITIDINGDLIDDLIFGGSAIYDPVIFGHKGNWASTVQASGLDGSNGFRINGNNFVVGDVNRDGIDDLIGSYWTDYCEVIFGHNGTWVNLMDVSTLDGTNGFHLDRETSDCASRADAVDINGDHVDDIIIGTYCADPSGKSNAGRSYVIFGHAGDWTTPVQLSDLDGINGFQLDGEAAGDESGYSVRRAGDVNGDGIYDVIVGAHFADPSGKSNAGRSYVIFGHMGNWTTPMQLSNLDGTNGFRLDGEVSGDESGYSVGNIGDPNGDGIDDIVICPYNSLNIAYIVFGRSAPIIVNNQLTISEGQIVTLDQTDLYATDVGSDDANLIFDITNLYNGQFEVEILPDNWVIMTDFNQQQITDGQVRFVHNGSESAPSYDVSVTGQFSTSPIRTIITFNAVNDIPVLRNNSLTINEGETVIITSAMLSATDVDNDDNLLSFIVSNVQNGQFELVSNPGVAITTFTQRQIINGEIQFVHDGSENVPSYDVMASDGELSCTSGSAMIIFNNNVNDMPVFINNHLNINAGQTIVLSADNLSATDPDNDDTILIFTVNNVQHGQFELFVRPGMAIMSFTQQQIINGDICFAHDGSEFAPSYQVSVSDGGLDSPLTAAVINFENLESIKFSISSEKGKNSVLSAILGGVLGGAALISCVVAGGIGFWKYRQNKRAMEEEGFLELDKAESGNDTNKEPQTRRKVVTIKLGDGNESQQLTAIEKQDIKFKKELGKGTFGVVFFGEWANANVAIKKLHRHMVDVPEILQDFEKEAAVLGRLNHPNIVRLYGVCRTAYDYYIVLEYASEGSLDNILGDDKKPFLWNPSRLQVAADITKGLYYVHGQDIWHRDLKSGNVLIYKDDTGLRAKLTDFGEAKVMEATSKTATKGRGTLSWMAPEVLSGEKYTEKADVYSYGIILWQLAAREKDPYKEESNQFALVAKVREGERPKIPSDCHPRYASLIKWCWHNDSKERPNIKEANQELDTFAEEYRVMSPS